MKIIFCVELYYPSIGGVQEVVRQLAERLVKQGHKVRVATTAIPERTDEIHNGVDITEFKISGNQVYGLAGEVGRYREFLVQTDADIVFFYAAQQWTFDAAWEVLSRIKARKVLVPCGYSGFYLNIYADYFRGLPQVLEKMDAVVYHAQSYRDIDFGRKHGLQNGLVIPNGADAEEFQALKDCAFRESLGVENDALLLLTVGSTVTGLKGHFELTKAFALADFANRQAVLIINGNQPQQGGRQSSLLRRFANLAHGHGIVYAVQRTTKWIWSRFRKWDSVETWIRHVNQENNGNKRVLQVDLKRDVLIQAYLQSDLFVFASNIEYSPLVLFESCAAGLPFLTVPVGNSREIVEWTGGGAVCEAPVDEEGYTRPDPAMVARAMESMIADPKQLEKMAMQGKEACQRRFNWANLTTEYEELFLRLLDWQEKTVDDRAGQSN